MTELPYSKALWNICKTFNVLPTNPDFQKLQPLQILWILNNLNDDFEMLNKSTKGETKSFETDLDTFLEEVNKLKNKKS